MFNCPLCGFNLEIVDAALVLVKVKEHFQVKHPKPEIITK